MAADQPKQRSLEPYAVEPSQANSPTGHSAGQGAEPARRYPELLSEPDRRQRASAGGRATVGAAQGFMASASSRNAQPNERAAVVDGADRLVYSNRRDGKGWRQPLLERDALNEARRHRLGDGAESGDLARSVRILEASFTSQPAGTRGPSTNEPTAYARGKAAARTVILGRTPQQSLKGAKAEPVASRAKSR
jgi:hypothetical protein